MKGNKMAELHKFLTSMEKYKIELPFYIDDLFSDEEILDIKSIIYKNKNELEPVIFMPLERMSEENKNKDVSRFQPKYIEYMSRVLIEFEIPKYIEQKLDLIAKPTYDGDIALCHYNYIEYNKKYSRGIKSPSLEPHIDADENLVTINYQLDSNIEWDVVIDGKHYPLKNNQAIVFSAVNQVHWRPKRKFKDGEFLEIISMDWCPTSSYRFTGENNPIDPKIYPEKRKQYIEELNNHPRFMVAWDTYESDGEKIGIPRHEKEY
jgi:hypothetical protein